MSRQGNLRTNAQWSVITLDAGLQRSAKRIPRIQSVLECDERERGLQEPLKTQQTLRAVGRCLSLRPLRQLRLRLLLH